MLYHLTDAARCAAGRFLFAGDADCHARREANGVGDRALRARHQARGGGGLQRPRVGAAGWHKRRVAGAGRSVLLVTLEGPFGKGLACVILPSFFHYFERINHHSCVTTTCTY